MNPLLIVGGVVGALVLLTSRKASGATPEDPVEPTWVWPVPQFTRVSSSYGWRTDPVTGLQAFHGGIDIAAAQGEPVYAAQAGRVIFSANTTGGYGERVELDHGENYRSTYNHMITRAAQVGDTVDAGDLVGWVGSTGKSTGPHLHFEIYIGDVAMDPLQFVGVPS
jgi:murein DD-endopeptidase MepM/ murein hydrolase activator NlpD